MGTIQDKDKRLVFGAGEGDTRAFRQLVDKYKDVSLSLACSILKDKEKAEDALQESFIKVFEKIKTFKFESSFSTWLYRIVVNTSYNSLKKNKNQISLSRINPDFTGTVKVKAHNTLEEEDQKRFIQTAFEKLRPDEALVLRLYYLCELKIAEIKVITGFKDSKIKVDLHRGRSNLNYQLKKLLGTEIDNLL